MKKKLQIRKETLHPLAVQVQSVAGGATVNCGTTLLGCAGSNNSCDICHQN